MAATGVRLADRAWTDLDRPIVLVPVGSCEQHGPHLPLSTDTIIATALAEAAAERTEALVAPALSVTASGEHAGFAGTLSIGAEVFTRVVIELVRSADWVDRLVLVNAHGGNLEALRSAMATSHADGRTWATIWSPRPVADAANDLHAGWVETSIMLTLRPDLVAARSDWPGAAHPDLKSVRRDGLGPHTDSGVIGDPSSATAAVGADIIRVWTDDLVAHIESGSDRG